MVYMILDGHYTILDASYAIRDLQGHCISSYVSNTHEVSGGSKPFFPTRAWQNVLGELLQANSDGSLDGLQHTTDQERLHSHDKGHHPRLRNAYSPGQYDGRIIHRQVTYHLSDRLSCQPYQCLAIVAQKGPSTQVPN